MGKAKTCLDPSLYNLADTGVKKITLFEGSLNFIAPALLLKKETEVAILDIPDILVAQQKWGGKLKVLGPVSGRQDMAVAFSKDSPELKKSFRRVLHADPRRWNFQENRDEVLFWCLRLLPDLLRSSEEESWNAIISL